MRKSLTTIILFLLMLLSVTAAVFLHIEGSLARITGWYHFRPGMALFPEDNLKRIDDVCWMRIQGLHDSVQCERAADGTWWITAPFRDRMSPSAAQLILAFTKSSFLVDTLPMNSTTRANLREFGVETVPHTITLKVPTASGGQSTVARYTLGSASPWLADAKDGEHVLPTTYLRTDFYGRDKRIHVVSGNILSIFRNGLQGLRDYRPLCFAPDDLRLLEIQRPGRDEDTISISRASAETPWVITTPIISEAEQNYMDSLVAKLSQMKAIRIDAPTEVQLPPRPEVLLTLQMEGGEPLHLAIYAPFTSPSDGQQLCYATVDNRPVVFTLPVEARMHRKGDYAELVNTILSLPVLPTSVQAQVHAANDSVYTSDLRLKLNELRSQRLSNISIQDVDRVHIRSRFSSTPVRLLRIPGEAQGQVNDIWMSSAGGHAYEEADEDTVKQFLNNLSTLPVAGFVEDIPLDQSVDAAMHRYGLHQPDYMLMLQPRECAARAIIFGVDLPLVKDRSTRTFYLKRYRDAAESYWVGMELGSHSIYRLSSKMIARFSFSRENWKNRYLVHFPISALRTLTLHFQLMPLVMRYDYIGESWVGQLGEEDVTLRINPHRTNYYVRHLQSMRVKQWLPPDDEDALQQLEKPVFSVSLGLEITDYSQVEKIVIDNNDDADAALANASTTRREQVETMLADNSELDQAFRHVALDDHRIEKRTITIDIAPVPSRSRRPAFYGRIRETGELFILSYEDAQSLGSNLLD